MDAWFDDGGANHGKDGTSSCEIITTYCCKVPYVPYYDLPSMELIDFRLCADRADSESREEGGAPEWQSGVSTVAELR